MNCLSSIPGWGEERSQDTQSAAVCWFAAASRGRETGAAAVGDGRKLGHVHLHHVAAAAADDEVARAAHVLGRDGFADDCEHFLLFLLPDAGIVRCSPWSGRGGQQPELVWGEPCRQTRSGP